MGSWLGGFAHFITISYAAQLMLENTVLSPYLETGTDLFAACATSFKGNMYLFGGVTVNRQVSWTFISSNSREIIPQMKNSHAFIGIPFI